MQTTTAFAPTDDDLAEGLFDTPVIVFAPPPAAPDDAEESEQGEP
ncbi:MAG TPA: hypothetical protein VLA78_13080 [Paracoccaceae bacterium]|jgi:hypothetical protein|nr:hypothetical protein [Paracoccaceae bacterium]